MKTVFWDIEAGGLKAQFDQVICAGFKPYGEKAYIISRKPSDTTDKELCIKIREELKKYDVVVSYYGLGYDRPFMNTRLLIHGEDPIGRHRHIDCYPVAKNLFKYAINSKRLVCIAELLGFKEKTRVEPPMWEAMKYEAARGKEKPLKFIVDHCLKDVEVLEKVYDRCFKAGVTTVGYR